MNWLARLKQRIPLPSSDATETTESVSVVSVAPYRGPSSETALHLPPAPDCRSHDLKTGCRNSLARGDDEISSRNASERPRIELFEARLRRFTDRGLGLGKAEPLARSLVTRDFDRDDRRLCLECAHLFGTGPWRCGNWRLAGVAVRSSDAQLPSELVLQLQRCDGFTPVL
jgi:hypothetical protein